MNNAPSSPAIMPIIKAAGKSSMEFSPDDPIYPNFNAPESDRLNGLPVTKDWNTERVKHAIEVAEKTLHNMLKVQKVFGLEIS